MQILGLLGMNFDALVVEVEKYLLFFKIGSGHTVGQRNMQAVQSISAKTSQEGIEVPKLESG